MNNNRFAAAVLASVLAAALPASAQTAPVPAAGETAQAAPAAAPVASAPAAAAVQAGVRPLDEIAAVVNDDVITEYELQQRTRMAALNLRRQNIKLPDMQSLRRQVLDQLILDKAINQRAREVGIRVDDQMVSAAIEQIAANNKVTVEKMRGELAADGVPFASFREQIRLEIVMQRLREREVDSQIQIPESEIDAYLAEQHGLAGGSAVEYNVSHILLPIEHEADAAKVEALAEEIVKRARAGEDFASLAASYSKASDSMSGGELGWRTSQSMPTVLWEAVKGNPAKGAVAMARNSSGFHIVKISDERNGLAAQMAGNMVKMTHARHILMQVSQLTPEATVLSRMTDIRTKILNGQADFQTMARLHSVDGSSTRGGDLGWLQPGDTVPEFETVMDQLKPGEISQPIKSRFGYHLIQVEERKQAQSDPRRERMAALQALREKKLGEAIVKWQRELRDTAYVEIRQNED